jgi:hypothetical protein
MEIRDIHSLLSGQRLMTLATCRDGQPWCAAVYYAHRGNRFYFFSSARSRHIQELLDGAGPAAASISVDHPDWREIRGVQMSGQVAPVRTTADRWSALRLYLRKFPFVKNFLREMAASGRLRLEQLLGQSLFVFTAQESYYLDNARGFGQRVPFRF